MFRKYLLPGCLSLLSVLLLSCDSTRGRIARPVRSQAQPVIRQAQVTPQGVLPRGGAVPPQTISKEQLCRSRGVEFANARAPMNFIEEFYILSSLEDSDQIAIDWRLMTAISYVHSRLDPLAPEGLMGIGNEFCSGEMLESLGFDPERRDGILEWDICSGIQQYKAAYREVMYPKRRGTYEPTDEDKRRLALAAYEFGPEYIQSVQGAVDQPLSWVNVCVNLPEEQVYTILKITGQYEYFKEENLYQPITTSMLEIPEYPPDEDVQDPDEEVDPDEDTDPDKPGDEEEDAPVQPTPPFFDPGDSPSDFDIKGPKGATDPAKDEKGRVVDVLAEEAKKARNIDTDLNPDEQKGLRERGLDWRLVLAIAWKQSDLDPNAVEKADRPQDELAKGIMQVKPSTAELLGFADDIKNLRKNVRGGIQYYRWILNLLHAEEDSKDPDQHRRKIYFQSRQGRADYLWTTSELSDRFHLAFSAYLAGPAHLSDAQEAARKEGLDPRRWAELRKVYPKLQTEEYCKNNKDVVNYGVCQGKNIVAAVENLFNVKYDALLKAYPPKGYEDISEELRREAEKVLQGQ